jgi:hypothetical protein
MKTVNELPQIAARDALASVMQVSCSMQTASLNPDASATVVYSCRRRLWCSSAGKRYVADCG